MTQTMSPKVIRAKEYATEIHKGQTRKYNGRPYITHPDRVCDRLIELGLPDNVCIAGELHDVLEECGKDRYQKVLDDIDQIFGEQVCLWVLGLTNQPKKRGLTRSERKQKDRERLSKQPLEVKIIKLVDRIDNLKELMEDEASPAFKKLYAFESLQLADALWSDSPELMCNLVAELRAQADLISHFYGENK